MELKVLQILALVLTYANCVPGHDVETTAHIKSMMGHRVTIPCVFTASDRADWMFMRWTRTTDGTTINIAVMQNNVFSADWSSSAPANFSDHVELIKKIEDNKFSLNLVIDGFVCSDVAVYTCEVFTMSSSTPIKSNTTLEIKAHPGTPMITANTIEVKENDTFRIECNSDVGVPAHTISWYYTEPEKSHIYQMVQEGFSQEDTPSKDCKFNARSTLTLTMTNELDRARFICTTSSVGEDGKLEKYDEVLIVLYGKSTTTESTPAATTQKPASTTEVSAATNVPYSISAITLCCLVTIFSLFRART